MNIKENVLEEIRTNEDIVKELSIGLDLTCEQVKNILIEDSLAEIATFCADINDMVEHLRKEYLEN